MSTNEKKTNKIVEKLIDSEKGFKQAASNITNTALKNYFHNKALEKSQFIRELKLELEAKGIAIDTSGSSADSIPKTWKNFKIIMSSDNENSMLEEAINREKETINDYQKLLHNLHLDLQTRTLLEKQKNIIEKGISEIQSLKDLERTL